MIMFGDYMCVSLCFTDETFAGYIHSYLPGKPHV